MAPILKLIFGDLAFATVMALLVTGGALLVSDEFKRYRQARVLFYIAAGYALGEVLMWSVFTSEGFWTRALVTLLAFGLVGILLTETIRATYQRENSVTKPEQGSSAPPQNSQSSGNNSPNTIIQGNQNQVNIYPPGKPVGKKIDPATGFHEAPPEEFAISLGSSGVSVGVSMTQFKDHRVVTPFKIEGVIPFKLSLGKHGELLFSFESWGNGVKVRVENNEVKISDPLLDRNFSPDAFEIVDRTNEPIFQMIRSPSRIIVNGVFPTETVDPKTGRPVILWISDQGFMLATRKPEKFTLKPLFKYPSWKYKGQYAD